MTHDGEENFAVWFLDDEGDEVELAANTIGSYSGSRYLSMRPGVYLLDVTADGRWTASIEQPLPAAGITVPTTLYGVGDGAPDAVQLSKGLHRFNMTHDGEENFAIWLYDKRGNPIELLANDIGDFQGAKAVGISTTGPYFLDIVADGSWAIEVS